MDETMFDFIEEHREELLTHIMGVCPNCDTDEYGNDEIEDWILNDEGLYGWAEECGVLL